MRKLETSLGWDTYEIQHAVHTVADKQDFETLDRDWKAALKNFVVHPSPYSC
jgi:hypothetical protein